MNAARACVAGCRQTLFVNSLKATSGVLFIRAGLAPQHPEHPMPHRRDPSLPLWPDASLDALLDLARSRYDVTFEPVSAGGTRIDVLQITNCANCSTRSSRIADLPSTPCRCGPKYGPPRSFSAICCAISRPPGTALLEIGAGLGVAKLVAAALGFERVVISDVNEDALLFAQINILKNGLQDRAEVRRVDILTDGPDERWTKRFSLILGSNILYFEPLYRPLAKFLKRRLLGAGASPTPEVYLASDHRRQAKLFSKRAAKDFAIDHNLVGAR